MSSNSYTFFGWLTFVLSFVGLFIFPAVNTDGGFIMTIIFFATGDIMKALGK